MNAEINRRWSDEPRIIKAIIKAEMNRRWLHDMYQSQPSLSPMHVSIVWFVPYTNMSSLLTVSARLTGPAAATNRTSSWGVLTSLVSRTLRYCFSNLVCASVFVGSIQTSRARSARDLDFLLIHACRMITFAGSSHNEIRASGGPTRTLKPCQLVGKPLSESGASILSKFVTCNPWTRLYLRDHFAAQTSSLSGDSTRASPFLHVREWTDIPYTNSEAS
ncbi:hypothetical protein AB1N83_013376 [Pleurotus pulmonarius]